MRKITLLVLMMGLLLPVTAFGQNFRLSDEALDSIHAKGLQIFMDFNVFFPFMDRTGVDTVLRDLQNAAGPDITAGAPAGPEITVTDNTITDSFNNVVAPPVQTIGDGNAGNNVLNGVQLNGSAQSGLSAFLNINAASSVIPVGINITVVQGNNFGTVNQRNSSFGMLNSSLFMFGGI